MGPGFIGPARSEIEPRRAERSDEPVATPRFVAPGKSTREGNTERDTKVRERGVEGDDVPSRAPF